jgi:hypothetical protein
VFGHGQSIRSGWVARNQAMSTGKIFDQAQIFGQLQCVGS